MLTVTENKGFSLKFENGLTISVQFGTGNYCSRRDYTAPYGNEMRLPLIYSANAEIAIWDESDKWFDFGNDQVLGWVSANEVAKWIERVSKAQNIATV